jgi:hypothetical protein
VLIPQFFDSFLSAHQYALFAPPVLISIIAFPIHVYN